MKKPKVSVCVVTYNQEKYIRQCLQSIVDQITDFEFEVIVADDCSTDNTRVIVQEYAEKYPHIVKPILNKNNIGAWKNFVAVHNNADGIYVSHMDGDDVMLPDKLKRQADYLDEHVECNIVWHRVNSFDDNGYYPSTTFDYSSYFKDRIVTLDDVLTLGSVAAHSSSMYRKSARYTKSPTFKTLDLFYTLEYLSTGSGKILEEVLGEYRVSASGSISKDSRLTIRRLCCEHAEFYFYKFPNKRHCIFIYSVINLAIDVKNLRRTSLNFFLLALKSFSISSLIDIPKHIRLLMALRSPGFRH